MPNEFVIYQANRKREAFGKTNRKLPKKLPVMLYPAMIEVFYENALMERIDRQEELINSILISNLPVIIEERDQDVPDDANIKTDDYADSLARLMAALTLSIGGTPTGKVILADAVANNVNVWNNKEWQKQVVAAIGVPLFQREPWLNATINSFVKENVSLITKMDATLLSSIEESIQRNFTAGASLTTIIKDIESRIGVTRSKASLIARDQVGKLNGNMTRLRQTNLGIRSYVWRDSDDRRVRPTHIFNDNKTFRWDSPPARTGHPGHDYQCRCYAEANFEEVFEELA